MYRSKPVAIRFIHTDGKRYVRTPDGIIYNDTLTEELGVWIAETRTIVFTKKTPTAPLRLSWFHFETTKYLGEINDAIVNVLEDTDYKTTPLVSGYFADNFEIRIYKGFTDGSYIVDCNRLGDDGLTSVGKFERIRRILQDEDEDEDEENIPCEFDFNGKSLDDRSYDDLIIN